MISIVIPTLNEGPRLARLLDALDDEQSLKEIIVVDGGSDDDSARIALSSGARLLASPAGRGRQLRLGAAAAAGDIILFLHADSVFPRGGLAGIEKALQEPSLVGGNFRLLFDGGSAFSRRLTGFYAWIRRHGLYYGDSAIFVRRAAYEELGGIRPIDLMEDYEFIRRLEKFGPTCCIEELPMTTSSRRFEGRGTLAVICGWLIIHALFSLGVPPRRLAQFYYRGASE